MSKFIIPSLLAAATLAVPAAAEVADPGAPRTIAVRFNDLDMASGIGQEELQRRIEAAARDVCAMSQRNTGSLTPSASSRTCYVRAINTMEREVAARIGNPEQHG